MRLSCRSVTSIALNGGASRAECFESVEGGRGRSCGDLLGDDARHRGGAFGSGTGDIGGLTDTGGVSGTCGTRNTGGTFGSTGPRDAAVVLRHAFRETADAGCADRSRP
jgi:hypothetical protein